MEEQVRQGHDVGMLFPAGNSLKRQAYYKKKIVNKIISYGLFSRNIVPLVFGVKNPESLDCSEDEQAYAQLLDDFKPEVIHVHSIQGIGESFFFEAKLRNIKLIFTTHDYYPICNRCNFINSFGSVCSGPSPEKCATCNLISGLSDSKARLMQSAAYIRLKDSKIVQHVRKNAKRALSSQGFSALAPSVNPSNAQIVGFERMITHSARIINQIDIIHANSKLASNYYSKYFRESSVSILPITHANLDFKSISIINKRKKLKIGYVGGANEYKGYKVLLDALQMLDNRLDWSLDFYGTPLYVEDANDERIHCKGFFESKDSEKVFSEMDLLVVPSVWPETFSFVVIEALCAGTPVICSDNVGAGCLLPSEYIYRHESAEALSNAIFDFHTRQEISIKMENNYRTDMYSHTKLIEELYT